MGAFGAGMAPAPVDRRLEEVSAGVDTRGVYVVVLGEVTHLGGFMRLKKRCGMISQKEERV